MGSLLPGWDSEPHETSKGTLFVLSLATFVIGVGAEMLEERKSLEKELHGFGKRPSVEAKSAAKPPTGPPTLARKSAPSSFVIRKLQEVLPEEDEDPEQESGETAESGGGKISRVMNKLFSRDKWWRKFSSANLNELAKEEENKMQGMHTYTPQFDLVGSDPYIKNAAK